MPQIYHLNAPFISVFDEENVELTLISMINVKGYHQSFEQRQKHTHQHHVLFKC